MCLMISPLKSTFQPIQLRVYTGSSSNNESTIHLEWSGCINLELFINLVHYMAYEQL